VVVVSSSPSPPSGDPPWSSPRRRRATAPRSTRSTRCTRCTLHALHALHVARCTLHRGTLHAARCTLSRRRCHVATLRIECVKVTRYRLARAGGGTVGGASYLKPLRRQPHATRSPILEHWPPRYLLDIVSNVKKTIDTLRPLRIMYLSATHSPS